MGTVGGGGGIEFGEAVFGRSIVGEGNYFNSNRQRVVEYSNANALKPPP